MSGPDVVRPQVIRPGLILRGGRVVIGDGPPVDALAWRDGRVVAAGSIEQVRAAAPRQPEVDLDGRLVTPAFVDAHLHCVQAGQVSAGLNLHGVASLAELLEQVATRVRADPSTRVIVGQGWDERSWPEQRPPSRSELDRAGGGRPAYLARVDVHSAVVSSALLDALPDITGAAGYSADGLLSQDAHHQCRGALHQLFSDAERRAAARTTLQAAATLGVAQVHELGGPHLGPLEDLLRVADEGAALGLQVIGYWGEQAGPEAFARMRAAGARGLAGDLCIDGAIGSRTAALQHNYSDLPGRGVRYLSDDEVTAHLVACTRAGVQAGFHCIGDEAVGAAVRGLRRTAEQLGPAPVRALRHRLEHVEMVAASDLATLADLGVVASVQPGFDAAWGGPDELYQQRLGDRSATMNPFASMQRAGVALAFGTDAPVTPLAGWQAVRDAVQHWRADERLSVLAAFEAATVGGYAAAGDDRTGRLRSGAPANLAVWETEPALLDTSTGLPRLHRGDPLPRCVATLVGGRVVFDRPGTGFELSARD